LSTQAGVEEQAVTDVEFAAPAPIRTVRLPLLLLAETTAIWVIAFWQFVPQAAPGVRLAVSLACSLAFVASVRIWRETYARAEQVLGRAPAIVLGACTAGALSAALAFLMPSLHIGPKGLVVTVVLGGAVVVFLQAVAAEQAVTRILVVGGGSGTEELIGILSSHPRSRFEIAGIVAEAPLSLSPHVPHWGILELRQAVLFTRPDLVIVAVDRGRPRVFERLTDVAAEGFRVVGLPEFFEHAYGRVPVRHLSPAWFMSVLHLYQRPYSRTAKRTFDITVALVGLLLILPLLPVIGLLVLTGGRPVIFTQRRLGEYGRLFTIYKFRTMRQNAETGGAVWAADADPRVTPFGRVLRKTRLDELPQLWNVLRGDMSIVGPRPERPEFLPLLEEAVPYWTRRHLLKPGITGWAQITHGYSDDEMGTVEKLSYDLWYLRHRSILVDVMICLRTLPYLFTGTGAR
jgi:exopolysaccharide biosynthesis polyprenyl glycosylphosphotransferase